jgi:membrane protein required for colicin V production
MDDGMLAGALQGLGAVDLLALVVLGIAVVRGLFRGLIGEAFSLGAVAAACLAARFGAGPSGAWLVEATGGEIGPGAAPWLTGGAIAVATIAAVAWLGRLLKRGASAAGLGWADRLGGGALGAAEGALVVAVGLVAATWLLGSEHPALEDSKSMETFAQLQEAVGDRAPDLPDLPEAPAIPRLPDVAARPDPEEDR